MTEDVGLGLGLKPGDLHYRAYVGPPQDYDLIAAMTFGLLTTLGLRQHHKLLDVGCGSLRVGRLLIPYLNPSGYVGIEPERWLVEAGIRHEVGTSQVEIKRPRFIYDDSGAALTEGSEFDFAVAQSVFSHTGPDLLERWFCEISPAMKETGALVATFMFGESDPLERGWVYPGCVRYREDSIAAAAARNGLRFRILNWTHPRQTWALLSRPGFPTAWLEAEELSWNAAMRKREVLR